MTKNITVPTELPEARFINYIHILIAVTIWGGSFAAVKCALAQAEPLLVLLFRFLSATPVLALGCLYEKSLRLPTRRELFIIVFAGFQGIFFHQWIQTFALQTASAGNANWIIVGSPAVVALLGRIFLKEKLSREGVFGLFLSAAGIALVLMLGTVKATAESSSFAIGDLIMVFTMFNWGTYLVISRKFLGMHMKPAFLLFWEMIFASLFTFITAVATGVDFSVVANFHARTWGSIIYLGPFGFGLAYLLWYESLALMPVAKLIVFQFLQPIIGMVISYFLIGERYTIWLGVGAVMIMCGIWLVNRK